jgi:hypothetical protein
MQLTWSSIGPPPAGKPTFGDEAESERWLRRWKEIFGWVENVCYWKRARLRKRCHASYGTCVCGLVRLYRGRCRTIERYCHPTPHRFCCKLILTIDAIPSEDPCNVVVGLAGLNRMKRSLRTMPASRLDECSFASQDRVAQGVMRS